MIMTTLLRLQDFDTSDSASFLYTLSAAYLDHTEQAGDEEMSGLNDEQHTLTALCYLDSQIQEGGFVQLIASGYGEYIFGNPVADSLRRWRIKPIPKILDKAKALYEKHGEAIEKWQTSKGISTKSAKLFLILKSLTAIIMTLPTKTWKLRQRMFRQIGINLPKCQTETIKLCRFESSVQTGKIISTSN